MINFYYELDECVRVSINSGLYVVTARKSRTENGQTKKYYQLQGAVTGARLATLGLSYWHEEGSLKKSMSESYFTFPQLMESLKNDTIQRDDFR